VSQVVPCTDRHDEANSRFSKFCEHVSKFRKFGPSFISPTSKVCPSLNQFLQNSQLPMALCGDCLYQISHKSVKKCVKWVELNLCPWVKYDTEPFCMKLTLDCQFFFNTLYTRFYANPTNGIVSDSRLLVDRCTIMVFI